MEGQERQPGPARPDGPEADKDQYQAAEKRLQRALADPAASPEKKKADAKHDEPPSTDPAGKPKMKGVDCGNSFLIRWATATAS